jgi:hypothetical protein
VVDGGFERKRRLEMSATGFVSGLMALRYAGALQRSLAMRCAGVTHVSHADLPFLEGHFSAAKCWRKAKQMSIFALGDKQGKIPAKFLASLHFPRYLSPMLKFVISQPRKSERNVVETHNFTYLSKTFLPRQYTWFCSEQNS